MNHKFTFLLLTLLLFSTLAVSQSMTDKRLDLLSTSSDAIIEGKILDSSTYINDDDGYVYTNYRVQISRILKGGNLLPSSEIVSFSVPGGVNGDLFTYVTHNSYFEKKMEGLFFFKLTNNTSLPYFKLVRRKNSSILYGKYRSIFGEDHLRLGIRELSVIYQKIEEITGVKCTKLRNNIVENAIEDFLKKEGHMALGEAKNNTEIVYVILSGISFIANNDSIKFNISLLSPNSDLKLSKTDLKLNYNTQSFGESVYSNDKIRRKVKDLAEENNYLDSIFDQAFNIVDLKLDINELDLVDYPNFSGGVDKLYEIKVKIQDISAVIQYFDDFYIDGEVYYKNENGDNLFNDIKFSVGDPFSKVPQIDSISPEVITAGTQDTMYIYGSNFSNEYQILMRNAGGITGSKVMISSDDIIWGENVIKVLLPSDAIELDGIVLGDGREPAGTGFVTLTNGVSTIQSPDMIFVKYAILNIRYPDGLTQARLKLSNANGNGGFTWKLHNNINSLSSDVRPCVEQAFCDFNKACGIQLELDEAVHFGTVIDSGDNSNTIGFVSDDPTFEAAGITYIEGNFLGTCSDSESEPRAFIRTVDIKINNNGDRTYNLNCGQLGSIETAETDFFQIVKHEIGHSLTIDHSLKEPFDSNQPLMYYTASQGESDSNIDGNDQSALHDAMNHSTSGIFGGSCPDTIHIVYYSNCDVLNSTKNIKDHNIEGHFKIYPNPTNGEVFITSISGSNIENIEEIRVYSINGSLLKIVTIPRVEYFNEQQKLRVDVSDMQSNQMIILKIISQKNEYNAIISFVK